MELVLGVFAICMQPIALGVVLTPPIAMAICRRRVVPSVLLYLAALGMLVGWFTAWNADFEWADRTGGQGNFLAGVGWFLGAVAAAAGATALTSRRGRMTAIG